jgi:isopentenyl phosphate kinase
MTNFRKLKKRLKDASISEEEKSRIRKIIEIHEEIAKEKKEAKIIFKSLKAGIVSKDKLSLRDIRLLRKYYSFMFQT